MRARGTHGVIASAAVVAALAAGVLTAPVAGAADGRVGTRDTGHSSAQAAMDAQVAQGAPGVVGQARDKHGVWNGRAGVGDLESQQPRSADDHFRAGSLTKTFTATVLLQLQAEGKLDLDDTVERYLPGVLQGNGHDGRKVTLRQLLNHTSGVFSFTDDPDFVRKYGTTEFLKHRYDTLTPQQLIGIALQHRPSFPPGTDWKYSNTNYVLAGLVIEKVTGRPYAVEVERRLVRPLGLRGTSFPSTSPHLPRPHSRAYTKFRDDPEGRVHDVTRFNPSAAWAAGQVISTTADLNRFYGALLGGEVLPAAELAQMQTTVATGNPSVRYGLGLAEVRLSCQAVWGHDGHVVGSRSYAFATPDARHTFALNLNGDWAGSGYQVVEAEFCGVTDGAVAKGLPKSLPEGSVSGVVNGRAGDGGSGARDHAAGSADRGRRAAPTR